jgi:ribonuclease BN (tRNA processing enzyme)
MIITLLGTGTPAPSLRRQGSGYLFEVGGDLLVMDHGPGAHHRLLESGYRAVEVSHAFFSHLHYDHVLDFPRLVLQRWDMGAGRIPELEVFGPPPLQRSTELLFGENGVYWPDIRARLSHQSSLDVFSARGGTPPRRPPAPRVTEVRPGDVVERPRWRVTVGRASHVQPHLECLAFRLDADDGAVCYSGDSGPCEELVDLARGCDVLIHMNHYLSGAEPSAASRAACGNHRDNAVLARRAGVRALVLTHLLEGLDAPGVRERIVHDVQQEFDGLVIWGEDLLRLELSGRGVDVRQAPGSGAPA